jgi:hypothetical protein
MKDSFSVQDDIFNLFTTNVTLMALLSLTLLSSNDDKNTRVRREDYPVVPITSDILPFVSLIFINSHQSRNFMVNNGVLELSIYASTRYDALNVYRSCKSILQSNYEDFAIAHEAQVPSGVVGIYKYSIRFSPMISA